MHLQDVGPDPQSFNAHEATTENTNYRTVAWTGKYLQVTLVSIPVGASIGLEVHPDTDQFLRLEAGHGQAVMGDAKDHLTFQQDVEAGWAILVPAGRWHDVRNTGDTPMQVLSVYAPSHHAQGIIQETAEAAEADEASGRDEAPSWTVQPK
ncbi:cupin domain-containing protein [Neoactinobaculum massilliense]|uniref:cupin domain-containing protein n=1 Tax=Neoactinobaculum massilliense TaxID=2364794 RepID=UPI000F5400E8|nr:cupin domain-containing protein [Neoactinobaculum massilliense]